MNSKNMLLKLLSLMIVLSVLITACGTPATEVPAPAEPDEPAATEAPAATESPAFEPSTTITYIASQDWIRDTEQELAKQFEAETGVHIDFQIIPSDQYFNVLETKLEAGGEGIDIFGGQSGKTDIKLQLNVEKKDRKSVV